MDSGFRPHELYLVDAECQAPFADAGASEDTAASNQRRQAPFTEARASRRVPGMGDNPRDAPAALAVSRHSSAWIAGGGVRLGIVSALSSSWFRASRSPHTLGGDPVMHAQTATAAATTDGRYSNFVPQATAQCILGPNRG